ncbi:3-oxoacyl-ACP synthase [Amycolatopsis sp. NPDC003676]
MKLGAGLGIRSIGTWFPATSESVQDALSAGRLTDKEAADSGIAALPVSPDLSPPEMAVLAAEDAVLGEQADRAKIGLVIHSWIHHQGHDIWSPAHYIAHAVGADSAAALGIQAMCNGSAAAWETAAAYLMADPTVDAVLTTTADRFDDQAFDRWSGDVGVHYGDGATASVLARRDDTRDALTLLAIGTETVSAVEGLHRGDDPFTVAPRVISPRIDVRRTKKAFLEKYGADRFLVAARTALRAVVEKTLQEAGIEASDPRLRYLTLPRVGRKVRVATYHRALQGHVGAEILDLGAKTGHLGAGDLVANCAELAVLLEPGQLALVINAGGGAGLSCAVVRRPEGAAEGSHG